MAESAKPAASLDAADAYFKEYWEGERKPDPALLLVELDAIIRARPDPEEILYFNDDAIGWIGRAKGALAAWDDLSRTRLIPVELDLHSGSVPETQRGLRGILVLLHEAVQSIR